jgi:hypothetical protein
MGPSLIFKHFPKLNGMGFRTCGKRFPWYIFSHDLLLNTDDYHRMEAVGHEQDAQFDR